MGYVVRVRTVEERAEGGMSPFSSGVGGSAPSRHLEPRRMNQAEGALTHAEEQNAEAVKDMRGDLLS